MFHLSALIAEARYGSLIVLQVNSILGLEVIHAMFEKKFINILTA